jgi:tetratricopeptide (TPR) repeat protein
LYVFEARAYNQLGQYIKAVESARSGSILAIDDKDKSDCLLEEGIGLYHQNDLLAAYKAFQEALAKFPKDCHLNEWLGNVRYRQNFIEDAIKFWILSKKFGCSSSELDQKIEEGKIPGSK